MYDLRQVGEDGKTDEEWQDQVTERERMWMAGRNFLLEKKRKEKKKTAHILSINFSTFNNFLKGLQWFVMFILKIIKVSEQFSNFFTHCFLYVCGHTFIIWLIVYFTHVVYCDKWLGFRTKNVAVYMDRERHFPVGPHLATGRLNFERSENMPV